MNRTVFSLVLIACFFANCTKDPIDRCKDLNFLINDLAMRSPVCDGFLGKPNIKDASYYIMFDEDDDLTVKLSSSSSFTSMSEVDLRLDDLLVGGSSLGDVSIGMHKVSVCKGVLCVDKYVYVEEKKREVVNYKPKERVPSTKKSESIEIVKSKSGSGKESSTYVNEPKYPPPNDGYSYAWRNGSWERIGGSKIIAESPNRKNEIPKPNNPVVKNEPNPPVERNPIVEKPVKVQPPIKNNIKPIYLDNSGIIYKNYGEGCDKKDLEELDGPYVITLKPVKWVRLNSCLVASKSNGKVRIKLSSSDNSYNYSISNQQVSYQNSGSEIDLSDFDEILSPEVTYTLTIECQSESLKLLDLSNCGSNGNNSSQMSISGSGKNILSHLEFEY